MTDFQKEIVRKITHASGVFLIPLLFWRPLVFSLFFFLSLLLYISVELAQKRNISIPLFTKLTNLSKRDSEKNHWSWGAILLLLSCSFLPLFFRPIPVALGLSQIFIADAAAALMGKIWGHRKIIFSTKKTWVGSSTYFLSAFLISLFWVSPLQAFYLAAAGSILEIISKDLDNLTIPLGIAFLVSFFQ